MKINELKELVIEQVKKINDLKDKNPGIYECEEGCIAPFFGTPVKVKDFLLDRQYNEFKMRTGLIFLLEKTGAGGDTDIQIKQFAVEKE